jgi:hypothetical protein
MLKEPIGCRPGIVMPCIVVRYFLPALALKGLSLSFFQDFPVPDLLRKGGLGQFLAAGGKVVHAALH